MWIRLGAVTVAAVATVQWWQLADRAAHIARMYWKFDDFTVTAGGASLFFFLVCSVAGAAIGCFVTTQARAERSWPFHVARFATGALIVGGLLWPAVIASPLVELVSR